MAKQKNKTLLAKERAEREIEDAKLLEYRDMISFGGEPLKSLMTEFYRVGRNVSGRENTANIIKVFIEYNATGKIELSTPSAVTSLTKTIRLVRELMSIRDGINLDTATKLEKVKYFSSSAYKKSERLSSDIDSATCRFVYEVSKMFDLISGIINAITLNYDVNRSFNDIIYQARKERLVNGIEYNSLKIFNSIRNLFAHNVGTGAMMYISTDSDMLLKIKAILLEVNVNVHDLVLRHKDRLELYLSTIVKANDDAGFENLIFYKFDEERYEELKVIVRDIEKSNNYKTNCLERITDARTNLM